MRDMPTDEARIEGGERFSHRMRQHFVYAFQANPFFRFGYLGCAARPQAQYVFAFQALE